MTTDLLASIHCKVFGVRLPTHLVRRDHERPGDITAILLVFDTDAGKDDTSLQVVLVRFCADFQVIFPPRLDDRRVDPIRVGKVDINELFVLAPDLHIGLFVVVAELLFAEAVKEPR